MTRKIVRFIRRSPLKALSLLLIGAFLIQIVYPALAAENAVYIEDIQLYTTKSDDADDAEEDAEEYFNKIGYTLAPYDLNEGTGTSYYVYMGFKTTTDRTKAVTDIKMMPMNGGYQTYNYDQIMAYMTSQASKTAATLKKAADDFAAQYNNGSPRAKDALMGLNLMRVPDADMPLGDYILSGAADQDFFAQLVAKSSSAVVHAVSNFLNIGVVPYENAYDEDGGSITVTWAEKLPSSDLWESYADGLTQDEENQLAQRYEDLAKQLFTEIQKFTVNYENARTRFENNDNTVPMSAEIDSMEEGAEHLEEMTPEDADLSYLAAYELLNTYDFDETTKLGDWFVRLGHETSDSVDLKLLYPVVESMSVGMASLVYMTGFIGLVWNLTENTFNEEFADYVAKFRKDFGDEGIDIYENLDEKFKGKTFGYTSEAIRKKGAENLPMSVLEDIDEKAANVKQKMKELELLIGIASTVVAFAALVAKIGIACTAPAVATAATTSSAFAFFSGMSTFISGIALTFTVASLALLAVSLIVAFIVWWAKKSAEENKVDYQSVKPDYFYDAINKEGVDSFVLYKSARDYSDDLKEPSTHTLIENKDKSAGLVGDLNAAKQWRWVVLCFTKDKYVGSPITADENGKFFKVVHGDPRPLGGWDSVKYFDERTVGDMNAHCEKNEVSGIYLHYRTEASLAARTDVPVNTPETEPATPSDAGPTTEPEAPPAAEPETNPTEPKSYIMDVIVCIGKDAMEAKSAILAHKNKFYVLDYNLSPKTKRYTYLGYALTENPNEAITDLRVAPYSGSGEKTPITYGDVTYTQVDILGYYKGKGSKQDTPQADALYYTDDPRAGSPIEADGLHPVASYGEAQPGWEPVSLFGCDLPYNFRLGYDTVSYEDYYSVALSYIESHGDHDLNQQASAYLYYEPSEQYTQGIRYLSGMFFAGGTDVWEYDDISEIDEADVSELKAKLATFERCGMGSELNLAHSIGKMKSEERRNIYQYVYYTWTYNPKRAVTDIALYQGDYFTTSLPYTMSKPLDGIGRDYVSAPVLQQQLTPETGTDAVLRYLSPFNCFMRYDAILIDDLEISLPHNVYGSYTKTKPEGIEFGYSKLRFMITGLYVSGPVDGLEPLALYDVAFAEKESDYQASTSPDGTVSYSIQCGTLDGWMPWPEKSFRPVVELKNPNLVNPISLSYPENWTGSDKYRSDTKPVWLFVKGQVAPRGKYISALSVGSFSRQQYKDTNPKASKSELKAIDTMVNMQAMVGAVSGCEDELIVYNVALKNQNNAWYNKQKDGKCRIEAPEDTPAAYLGVNRSDSRSDAITGVVFYKSKLQLASETIEIDGVTYTCAGTSAPIFIGKDRFYLYYTKNTGAVPGVPIREITIDDIPLISGTATNLCGSEGSQKLYGNVDQPTFIHLHYDQDDIEFYNKLYVGHGVNERAAMCDLLTQGCVQYVDLDLNSKADGDTVLLGYRSGCHDWEAINELSGSAQLSELARQEKEAIYDIILTNDEPYHPEGIVSKGIYYTPASSSDITYTPVISYEQKDYFYVAPTASLNSGCDYGAEIYMYYASPYYSANYNKKNFASTTLPETVFTGYITKLAFAENERVPYTTLLENNGEWVKQRGNAEATGNIEDYYPWEYVMYSGDTVPADLNEGIVLCNGDYCEETRLYMFARRSDGSVKPAGQITGGYVESKYTIGDVYLKR